MVDLKKAHDEYLATVRAMKAANGVMNANFALSTTMRGVGNKALASQYYYLKKLTILTRNYTAMTVALADQMRRELDDIRKGAKNG